jgi:hypothetical protein
MSGFNPASNATSNLPQSHVIFYDNVFVENLKAQTLRTSLWYEQSMRLIRRQTVRVPWLHHCVAHRNVGKPRITSLSPAPTIGML